MDSHMKNNQTKISYVKKFQPRT